MKLVQNQLCKRVIIPKTTNKKSSNTVSSQTADLELAFPAVNDRKYVFHFRPKPNIWPEKHLALGRIPKPKPKVQIFVKIGGILL